MFNSMPELLQTILWPLCGGAIVLATGGILPDRIRRLIATLSAFASLVLLWSLTIGQEQVQILWEPFSLFRTGPSFRPDGLGLMVGIILSGVVGIATLGIRGDKRSKGIWHGFTLILLAGGLVMIMATNLLTLALGSGLVDLALIAWVLYSPEEDDRVVWRMLVPSALSTLLLFLSTLQMSIRVGTTSLLTETFPQEVLFLLSIAGLLRLLVFPIHVRHVGAPRNALTQLLTAGLGLFLLARVQSLAPFLIDQRWMLTLAGVGLAAGGLLAWTAGTSRDASSLRSSLAPVDFPSLLVYQTSGALAFALLAGASAPWPVLSVLLALSLLALGWESESETDKVPRPPWLARLVAWVQVPYDRVKEVALDRVPILSKVSSFWPIRHMGVLLPAAGILSLAGAPFTVGGVGRWMLYAALLQGREAGLLIVTMVADVLLTAELWKALRRVVSPANLHQTKPKTWLPMSLLAAVILLLGIAPRILLSHVGLERLMTPNISVWGLGFIFVLPWLVGGWLARATHHLGPQTDLVHRIVNLDWLYAALSWMEKRISTAVGWFGRVGEGEGWFGWSLIILALALSFLAIR